MSDRDFSAVQQALSRETQTSQNRQTLMATIQSVAVGKFEDLHGHFTEDIELHIHGFAPLAGSWRGAAEVVAAMATNFDRITGQQTAIAGMIEQGDAIAVRLEETGRFLEETEAYHIQGVIWFHFRDGKVSSVTEFIHPAIQPARVTTDDH